MKVRDIRNALKARLASGSFPPGTGFAWPNVDFNGALPYFDTSFTGLVQRDFSIEGGQALEETGQFNAGIVVESGTGEDFVLGVAGIVSALFVKGTSIAIPGGNIVMLETAQIGDPVHRSASYRVPIAIRYHALRI